VKGAGIFVWPKAIHEGQGKAAFIVDPATTDKQAEALAQIFTGQLGESASNAWCPRARAHLSVSRASVG